MTKDKNKQGEGFKEVEQALTKTEQFLENHLNIVLYVIGGLVVVVLGYLGIQKFVVAPKNVAAQEAMFQAQNYFSVDSFELAVNGDGSSLGFLDIIDSYGSTDAGNLSQYYAGISYLHLGEYETAIDHLKKFDTDDLLLAPLAKMAIGDAYVEMEEYSKAVSSYNAALSENDNEFTAPTALVKLGVVYEAMGDTQKAIEAYEKVKNDYPKSSEAMTVEKSIARVNQ